MPFNSHLNSKKVLSFSCLLLIFFIIVIAIIYFKPSLVKYMKDPVQFGEYVKSFGMQGIFIFIGFQILQVVIAALPGEITQLAGGFVYGTFVGTALSYIGITIGMIIVFFFVRLFGMPLVRICLSEKQMEKFNFIVTHPRAELVVFVLFVIPGIPKDVLTYLAGLAPFKPYRFILFASLARLPGIFLSSYIGANLVSHRYVEAVIVSVLAILLFFIGLLLKEKIVERIKNVRII